MAKKVVALQQGHPQAQGGGPRDRPLQGGGSHRVLRSSRGCYQGGSFGLALPAEGATEVIVCRLVSSTRASSLTLPRCRDRTRRGNHGRACGRPECKRKRLERSNPSTAITTASMKIRRVDEYTRWPRPTAQ